jgi:hypothetical protein
MYQLQTTTLSNQNISSALLTATYTATATKSLVISSCLDQIAGNGNYQIYVTKKLAGVGSAYQTEIVTEVVPNGVTNHAFKPIEMPVDINDVVKVYVIGLGGDVSTPDIITRFYEEADAFSVWEYESRTITQSAVELAAIVAGTDINIYNDTSVSIPITGLGVLTGWTEIIFTVKYNATVVDASSVIQITKNHGLLRLYGVTTPTAGDGVLTINSESAGNITLTLAPASSAILPSTTTALYYDVKLITASAATILTSGRMNILQSVTRAVT